MADAPVTLDFSKSVPIGETDDQKKAAALRQSVSYGASQNPDQYAKLITLHKQTGIPPVVSQGNEQEVQHAADVDKLDYGTLVASHPRTAAWASNPDNAAVAGVDEVQRLANIESRVGTIRALTPWESFDMRYLAPTRQKLMEMPLTRMGVDAVAGASGMIGNVASFFGVHGDGATKQNALQRFESYLSPENADLNVSGRPDTGNAMDTVVKNVAPMIPVVLATGGTGLLARTLGLSANAAKVLSGLSVGAMFTADQGGSTYTQMSASGASDYESRLAANRVAAINAPVNALFGMTDLVPYLKDNPLLTSTVLGGAQGASGQLAQNVITHKPLSTNLVQGMLQGAGVQAGMHMGTGFFSDMASIVADAEQSKLKARSPEKFHEALSQIFDGQSSLRIPAEQFDTYFQSKNLDPASVAQEIGAKNYLEAKVSGGEVEIAPEDFIGKLDSEHQKGLLGDVVNPSTGMTLNQQRDGEAELQKWASEGGPEKLSAETAKVDAETQASDEYQTVKSQLKQQYVDAGETDAIAENYATLQANVYANLARETGMKPAELMGLYRPVMRTGEAPGTALKQASNHDSLDELMATWKERGVDSYVSESKLTGNIELSRIVVPESDRGKGTGTEFMKELTSYADANGKTVVLTPSKDFGASSVSRLKEFYKRFGFVENNGRNRDLTISEDMIRRPQEALYQGEPVRVEYDDQGNVTDGDGRHRVIAALQRGDPYIEVQTKLRDGSTAALKVDPAKVAEKMGVTPESLAATDAQQAEFMRVLYQTAHEGAPRGWFRALPDGSFEIGKTKIGDLSTFIHEPAHSYLEIIRDLSSREGVSETLKSDYQKVLDFLGAKEGEKLTVEQHEKWARANEQYLREGKAPSQSLRGVFQRFAVWLSSIYKRATDLGVELSDDIRGVMDRMYAAEEGVNRAEQESGPKLFSTPEEAGWTPEQFQAYAESKGMEVDQAKAEILSKLNEAAVRDRSESWREEENSVREAVTATVDQKPEYQAIRALRKGQLADGTELTIGRPDLVKQFGEERVKELQKQHPGLYRNDGGMDAETASEMLGYNSGEEMMRALETAPKRSAAIETATREYMTAKHGDIRYDGTLDDQARIALENDRKADNLHKELKALQKKVGDLKAANEKVSAKAVQVAPIQAYREAAHQLVEAKSVADLQPTRYLDASRVYSREAFEALRKGDVQEAAAAKHKELLNHFLFREAAKAKEYVGKFENYVQRATAKPAQQKLGLAGGDYRNQFNRLLGRYGLGPATEATGTLAEWASGQYDAGKEAAIDPSVLNENRTINYRKASVAEIRAVHDALVNIQHLASQELRMTVNGRKVEFDSAKQNMIQRAHESLATKPTRVLERNATFGEKASDLVQRGDAMLMRTERLMEWLDGGKEGPWHDYLWHLASDSQGQEYALQEQVTKAIGDALENMPKEQRMKMLEKVTVEGIPETVTRHDLVSMAFNMGNEGNMDRLTKTFMTHGWDPAAIEQIKGLLTREEWQFVQDGWNSLKPLGERMVELEKRLTGLAPVMVKPTPLDVKLADGTEIHLDGGYYPVQMDPRFSQRGAQMDAGKSAQNLMEAGYGRAVTSRGYTKERTGFGGPMLLDYEQVLTQHTAKVIKDITHREFMLTANKLLMDPEIRQTLRETMGAGYEEKMMPWLRTIINDRNGSAVQGLSDFSRAIRALRSNLTLATLSFKASTSLLQWTHAPRMLLLTKPGSYTRAMVDFLAHPGEMTQQIKELSPNEMRFRGENLDRDVRDKLMSQTGQKSISKDLARIGNLSIKYTDHVLSFPLWLSVYRDALKEHIDLPEKEAKYQAMQAADSAIRLGLGSAAPKDLPPIMRNNDLSKLITMFYSFHNGIYGQVRDIAHQTNGARDIPKMTYGLAMSVLIPAVLSQLVVGRGPKDDENFAEWAAKRALLFSMDTMPVLRDVASAMDSDGDVKFTPFVNVMSKGAKATMQATADKEDKDWGGIGLNYLEVGMDAAGVPGTNQILKPVKYMRQVEKGNIRNPNVWDAVVGSPPQK